MNRLKVHLGIALSLLLCWGLYLLVQYVRMPDRLLSAAINCDVESTRELLDKGVDINTKDGWSSTAISYAAANGCTDVVKLLLTKGANVNGTAEQRLDRTSLMWAAHHGRNATVILLLESGADTNLRDEDGEMAVSLAKMNGHLRTVEIIESFRAKK